MLGAEPPPPPRRQAVAPEKGKRWHPARGEGGGRVCEQVERMPMGPERLRQLFIDAARAHSDALDEGRSRRANRAHDRVIKAIRGARIGGDGGRAFLESLAQHEDPRVRGWAATYLLPMNESLAIVVLEELAATRTRSCVAFNSQMVLELWKDGTLKLL